MSNRGDRNEIRGPGSSKRGGNHVLPAMPRVIVTRQEEEPQVPAQAQTDKTPDSDLPELMSASQIVGAALGPYFSQGLARLTVEGANDGQ